jgi:hypothetical protein
MWKMMMEWGNLIGLTMVVLIAFAVSCFGVMHLGWYVDLFGLLKNPLDASQSILALTIFGAVALMPFACLALILAQPLPLESQEHGR